MDKKIGVEVSWTTENFEGFIVEISCPSSFLKITLEQLKHKETLEFTSEIAFFSCGQQQIDLYFCACVFFFI